MSEGCRPASFNAITACVTAIAEIGFRRFLHLGENEGADLARAVFLAPDFDPSPLSPGTIW
jgi:hypothetical protein